MTVTVNHYSTLADLFSYPGADFVARVREVQALLDETCTIAADELREFTEFAEQASAIQLEEIYTRSFDVQAVTTLDIGYVLFGDDYKRGEMLVHLSAEHREAGVDCGTELSDHLPNVLRLLDAMRKPELRAELVKRVIAPALRKIIGEFDPARLEKKNAVYMKHHRTLIERSEHFGTIYGGTLRALYAVLERDFDVASDAGVADAVGSAAHHSRFLNSISTEMTMETNRGKCHGSD